MPAWVQEGIAEYQKRMVSDLDFSLIEIPMAKRTKKVGITGKYGTRYGATLRKLVKKIEIQTKARYLCSHCGKTAIRRTAAGIWECKAKTCNKKFAGGCWMLKTAAAESVQAQIHHLRKGKEETTA